LAEECEVFSLILQREQRSFARPS